eukprot:356312-Chlamydomonas_euryale.AAC.4
MGFNTGASLLAALSSCYKSARTGQPWDRAFSRDPDVKGSQMPVRRRATCCTCMIKALKVVEFGVAAATQHHVDSFTAPLI